jgi:hypothetical protein
MFCTACGHKLEAGANFCMQCGTALHIEQLGSYKGLYVELDIVGESYRQDALRQLWTGPETTFDAVMIPESNNPHDRNAVRVEIKATHVGYLSRETAEAYRSYRNDKRCKVPVHLVREGLMEPSGCLQGKVKPTRRKLGGPSNPSKQWQQSCPAALPRLPQLARRPLGDG